MKTISEKIESLENQQAQISNEIEALKRELAKKKLNVVTQWPSDDNKGLHINGKWAANVFITETEGDNRKGSEVSGHKASLYLCFSNGTWYTQSGEKIKGYLYYKPNSEDQ